MSAIVGYVMKRRPKSFFFTVTIAIFSKSCFYRPLRFYGHDLKNLHKKCQNTFCNLLNCSLRVVLFAKREEIAQFFLFVTIAFSSKNCVFNNRMGVEEMISELASNLLKKRVEPNLMLLNVCHCRYFEKKLSKFFFTRTIAFF